MIALLLLAAALPGAPSPVEAAIRATLPAELSLVQASVPARFERDGARGAVVVEWRTPPRAGASRVAVSRGASKAWVSVVLAAAELRPVAARALEAGDVIGEDDVVLTRSIGGRSPLGRDVVVGATARTALSAGAALDESTVALAPPLPRGTAVTVIAEVGALRVSRAGRLEAPARVGELARVRLADVPRLARARLSSPTTAVLENDR